MVSVVSDNLRLRVCLRNSLKWGFSVLVGCRGVRLLRCLAIPCAMLAVAVLVLAGFGCIAVGKSVTFYS